MKRFLVLLLAALFVLPLAGCGEQSLPRDFYSLHSATEQGVDVGTIWLGMTKEEQRAAIGDASGLVTLILKLGYVNDILVSMTGLTGVNHPVGITFDMTKDQIEAYYAKDPDVTVTEEPNLLTATKTIDGTLYYTRIVLWNDGTIKETNQTTDPSVYQLQFPKQ